MQCLRCRNVYPAPSAVLLENFSIFYNEDDTNLSHSVVRDFRHNWLHFDKDASVGPPPSPPAYSCVPPRPARVCRITGYLCQNGIYVNMPVKDTENNCIINKAAV